MPCKLMGKLTFVKHVNMHNIKGKAYTVSWGIVDTRESMCANCEFDERAFAPESHPTAISTLCKQSFTTLQKKRRYI